jgi:hypothetical protein
LRHLPRKSEKGFERHNLFALIFSLFVINGFVELFENITTNSTMETVGSSPFSERTTLIPEGDEKVAPVGFLDAVVREGVGRADGHCLDGRVVLAAG